jgi:23S rRNA (uridine2552-2'-O)-methyltransferase
VSRLGDRRHRHDSFHQRAKREGFAARSVFKLEEIQERYRVLKPRARVLDLGCRPGSWLQYAARIVGPEGRLVGLDRQPLDVVIPAARVVVGDVLQVSSEELRGELDGFDVVLSDMAPDTSGIRSLDQARSETLFERALEIAEETLAPGGAFVAKLFQGPDFKNLVERCRRDFAQVATPKPQSSRKDSIELYVVASGRRC